jgi:hypothetical protein
MGDGLRSTDMLASAAHLLPTARRCRARRATWEEGPDPRIFTLPWGAYTWQGNVGKCNRPAVSHKAS